MSTVRRVKSGKYQVDIQDKFRGVPRTKRTFPTRKEAEDWRDAVRRDATSRLLGHKRRRLFGEALARYLREESPKKRTHHEDLLNAKVLRWPVWDHESRRWLRLEETPLDDVPQVMSRLVADHKGVLRRAYIGHRIYHLRQKGDGSRAWYHQPDPARADRPEPRAEITDAALAQRLDGAPGRGPFNSGTLRIRQLLVTRVLRLAWEFWSTPSDKWLDQDIAGKISLEAKAPESQRFLAYDQLLALVIAAPIGFDEAILGAAWIGWRRANILGRAARGSRAATPGLEWANVVFPIVKGTAIVQAGYLWMDRAETKNGKPLAQPLSDRVLQLLQLRWEQRVGRLVFHRGDGRGWTEFKNIWRTTKKRAGIDPRFRFHDLRHTYASEMIRNNVSIRHVQELLGHADISTTQMYAHLQLDHLQDAVNAPTNQQRKPT